jgi:glutaminase
VPHPDAGQGRDHIPELATMPPEQFGLALATIDGKLDSRRRRLEF